MAQQQLFLPSVATIKVSPRSEELNMGLHTHSDQYALEDDFTLEESKESNGKYHTQTTQGSGSMQGTQGAQTENNTA